MTQTTNNPIVRAGVQGFATTVRVHGPRPTYRAPVAQRRGSFGPLLVSAFWDAGVSSPFSTVTKAPTAGQPAVDENGHF